MISAHNIDLNQLLERLSDAALSARFQPDGTRFSLHISCVRETVADTAGAMSEEEERIDCIEIAVKNFRREIERIDARLTQEET